VQVEGDRAHAHHEPSESVDGVDVRQHGGAEPSLGGRDGGFRE
jgi:hypothetical protein